MASTLCFASSSESPLPPQGPSSGCTAAEHRQFDFWLGQWKVTGPEGKFLGTNLVRRSETGCWIMEQWRGAGGFSGASINAWDAQHRLWRQFWVGSDGMVLRLEGGLRAGAMVMEGVVPTPGAGRQRQKISWVPHDDGTVSQRWETSDDEGRSWSTAFLGIYRRDTG